MAVGRARKPKFRGKRTKWEKKRRRRAAKRRAQGKIPLVEPLTIAPAAERNAALKNGWMFFYDGKRKVEVKMELGDQPLQGIYKRCDGRIITLRRTGRSNLISAWEIVKTADGLAEFPTVSFFSAHQDLGHMRLEDILRGHGLGIKGASKAERHVRALQGGRHRFTTREGFLELFTKLGYGAVLEQQMPHRGSQLKKGVSTSQGTTCWNGTALRQLTQKQARREFSGFPLREAEVRGKD